MRQAFDPRLADPGVLEGAQQVVGHGADVTVRTARRHDQAVGDRAFVFQVDVDDVLRLIVVETGKDQVFEAFTRLTVVSLGADLGSGVLIGRFMRQRRRVVTQRIAPGALRKIPNTTKRPIRQGDDSAACLAPCKAIQPLRKRSRIAVDEAKFSGPVR